jgi:hypothetical protein
MGLLGRRAVLRWAVALVTTSVGGSGWAGAPSPSGGADRHEPMLDVVGAPFVSGDAQRVVRWVAQAGDADGQPYAVVDKRHARIYVFDRGGRLAGSAPALLGQAHGDSSAPGVGAIAPAEIPPALRTTPAGRFASQPGRNTKGEAVVWVDYATAIAIHRLRPAPAAERRAQRLASPSPQDNRISLGCVVVDGVFYDSVVAPILGRERGVVYVLPEHTDVAAWLQAYAQLH